MILLGVGNLGAFTTETQRDPNHGLQKHVADTSGSAKEQVAHRLPEKSLNEPKGLPQALKRGHIFNTFQHE
jgi:hypothetical protein